MKKFFSYDPKLLVYGFLIVFFASYGQTFFISLFNIQIRTHYNLSSGEFGLVYALATTLSSLVLVFFAKLIDFIDLRTYSFFVSLDAFFQLSPDTNFAIPVPAKLLLIVCSIIKNLFSFGSAGS